MLSSTVSTSYQKILKFTFKLNEIKIKFLGHTSTLEVLSRSKCLMSTVLDNVEQKICIMAESSIGQYCQGSHKVKLETRWFCSGVHTQNYPELSYFPPSINNKGTGTQSL